MACKEEWCRMSVFQNSISEICGNNAMEFFLSQAHFNWEDDHQPLYLMDAYIEKHP